MYIVKVQVEGVEELQKKLNSLKGKMKRHHRVLQRAGIFLKSDIRENFESMGSHWGVNWAPLSETTKKIKKALGYGNKPPMVRTGALKEGFVYQIQDSTGKGVMEVYNIMPYFVKHQSSNSVDRRIFPASVTKDGKVYVKRNAEMMPLPRRVMLKLTKDAAEEIKAQYKMWVLEKIKDTFGDV